MKKQTEKRSGFTLAELMVVIVIIGLLVTVVMPNVIGYLGKGRATRVKADIKAIDDAIQSYAMFNNGHYPDSLDALLQPDENGNAYLRRRSAPTDPWGNEYLYDPPTASTAGDYLVYTYGADGTVGGEGENGDYDHRMLLEE